MRIGDLHVLKVVAVLLAVICLAAGFAYAAHAAIPITSNPVTVSPQSTPTILMTVNNALPYVGDTVTFTATLSNQQSNVPVVFQNAAHVVLGTVNTDANGVAVFPFLITSLDAFTVHGDAVV